MRSTPALALTVALVLAGCSGGADQPSATEAGSPGGDAATAPGGDLTGSVPEADDETGSAPEGEDARDSAGDDGTGSATDGQGEARVDGIPDLDVQVMASGLSIPWDVQLLPDGAALVGERGGRLLVIPVGGEPREVDLGVDDLFAQGEGGLMGLAVSPDVADDRLVYACYASQGSGAPRDVRVVGLALDEELTRAEPDRVVVEGLPITTGRHSGCRLLLSEDGQVLLVGTGDAADAETSQSPISLGGKVLAVSPDGDPLPGAPFVEGADPRIITTGHRNVQGLAVEPGAEDEGVPGVGVVWSVEHGPDVDDEVNVLVPGGNYGWDPGPGYDERVPMTDLDTFADAVEAVWSSGRPTHATSGAVFLEGGQWGDWEGSLAVAELKGSGVTVLTVDGQSVTGAERVAELDGTHGRLRSLTLGPDGALWVTTSDGEGRDEVLRVTPSTGS